ncbi:hypothetical protein D1P53_006237 [Cryptococcus gattii VGV]|nr:hypothetical protein D1P53_006237 [Cryptococcus gattii VGV]
MPPVDRLKKRYYSQRVVDCDCPLSYCNKRVAWATRSRHRIKSREIASKQDDAAQGLGKDEESHSGPSAESGPSTDRQSAVVRAALMTAEVRMTSSSRPRHQALITRFRSNVRRRDSGDVSDDENENGEDVGFVKNGEADAVPDADDLEPLVDEPGGEVIVLQGEEPSATEEALANTYRQIGHRLNKATAIE